MTIFFLNQNLHWRQFLIKNLIFSQYTVLPSLICPACGRKGYKSVLITIWFFKALEINTVLSVWAVMVLTIFGCLFMVKIKYKVSACFCENIYWFWTSVLKSSSRSFLQLSAAIWFKRCSESRLWFWCYSSESRLTILMLVPKAACNKTVHAGWFPKASEGREANFGAALGNNL